MLRRLLTTAEQKGSLDLIERDHKPPHQQIGISVENSA